MTGMKLGLLSLVLCGFMIPVGKVLKWRSPEANMVGERDIHKSIQQDENKLNFVLTNEQGTQFCIDLVKNCKPDSINPHFPAIYIKTNPECNAWAHIVYTDAKDQKLRTFIDALEPSAQYSNYPFYARSNDFADAPLWTYGLFSKPLSFWKGHAFALLVDDLNKTVKCLGGVEWGFELHYTNLRPVAIIPRLLDENAWTKACQLLKKELADYEFSYFN